VSRLATSHFHLKIAERIGETDGIKALDRNGKALEKEKCRPWVVSVSRDSMAQCRNEVSSIILLLFFYYLYSSLAKTIASAL